MPGECGGLGAALDTSLLIQSGAYSDQMEQRLASGRDYLKRVLREACLGGQAV